VDDAAAAAAAAAATAAAYLLGTFPTAVLVARSKGHDVMQEGSGNPGATNVYRVAGRRAGAAVFAGDFVKGALPTAIAAAATKGGRTDPLTLAVGAAAVLGHCLPVTRRFQGGKGVATAAGFAAAVEPVVGAAAAAAWFAVFKLTRRASVASLAVAAAAPVAVLALRGPHLEAAALGATAAFVVSRHRRNITRLLRGEETSLTGVDRRT
jgi:glycerol-3-phosphate acyltransferase PlsY